MESKKGFLISARYKNGNRTEDVRIESDNVGLYLSGPDFKRFLVKIAIEKGYRNQLQQKRKGWELMDIQVVHLRANEYVGFATVSRQGKTKEIVLYIKDLGDKIQWQVGTPASWVFSF